MSILRQRQSDFVLAVSKLIEWSYENGYEITFGDAFAHDRHIDKSFHYKRLAIDLNLFWDGEYLTKKQEYMPLGRKWRSLGGTWGGDFSNNDANHFSWGETR